ncbi:hypothetical protein [Larkinella ripae]
MKKLLISASILGVAFASCQPSDSKKEIQQMQDQVMAVHDSIMPKEDVMLDFKEKISLQIDSLSKITPTSASLKSRQDEGMAINQSLTEANTLMYDWMHHYRADTLKGMDEAQAKAYLDRELKRINEVKVKINGGIAEAKKFLAN